MRIARVIARDGRIVHAAEEEGGLFFELEGNPATGFRRAGRAVVPVRRLAPVAPAAILCVGLNYRAHAEETGAAAPEQPVLFMKNPAALNHPDSPIVIPRCCSEPPQVDYEVELAVVVGKPAKDVPASRAKEHILGYTVANDISARHWQSRLGGGQWCRAKGFDSFCPMGPCLVTPDSLDPCDLRLTCRVNGTIRQDARTSDMIFSVHELIARLSAGVTLLPGTAILTGTPSGVAAASGGPYLAPGDRVEAEIEGIGVLRNTVEAEREPGVPSIPL